MARELPLLCALPLPPCPAACRSIAVPNPLGTAGDPSSKIRCSSGTPLFDPSNTTYPIQSLILEPSSFLPITCIAADLPSDGLQWDPLAGVRAKGCGKDRTALIAGLSVGLGVAVALTASLITFFLYKRHLRLVEEQDLGEIVNAAGLSVGLGVAVALTASLITFFLNKRHLRLVEEQDLGEIVNAGGGQSTQDLLREINTRQNLASRVMASKLAKILLPVMQQNSPPDIEAGCAQPATAQVPDLPTPNSTFSGVLVTLCFTSALESLVLFLQLQNDRPLPVSFHLFSLAITCAFATTFLQKIIHFRPNDKFAALLETVGKAFFAIAFCLAVVIPSPLWLRIVEGVILFFGLVVVFKYRRSSCANPQVSVLGLSPHDLLLTTHQDAAAINTNRHAQQQPPDPSVVSTHPRQYLLPL